MVSTCIISIRVVVISGGHLVIKKSDSWADWESSTRLPPFFEVSVSASVVREWVSIFLEWLCRVEENTQHPILAAVSSDQPAHLHSSYCQRLLYKGLSIWRYLLLGDAASLMLQSAKYHWLLMSFISITRWVIWEDTSQMANNKYWVYSPLEFKPIWNLTTKHIFSLWTSMKDL